MNKVRKVGVRIGLKKHGAIWEDFWDGFVSESRRKEKGIPYEQYRASPRNAHAPSLGIRPKSIRNSPTAPRLKYLSLNNIQVGAPLKPAFGLSGLSGRPGIAFKIPPLCDTKADFQHIIRLVLEFFPRREPSPLNFDVKYLFLNNIHGNLRSKRPPDPS